MISITDAKAKLPELVTQLRTNGGEVVLTRHGKPAAKLVPVGHPAPTRLDWHREIRRIHAAALKPAP